MNNKILFFLIFSLTISQQSSATCQNKLQKCVSVEIINSESIKKLPDFKYTFEKPYKYRCLISFKLTKKNTVLKATSWAYTICPDRYQVSSSNEVPVKKVNIGDVKICVLGSAGGEYEKGYSIGFEGGCPRTESKFKVQLSSFCNDTDPGHQKNIWSLDYMRPMQSFECENHEKELKNQEGMVIWTTDYSTNTTQPWIFIDGKWEKLKVVEY